MRFSLRTLLLVMLMAGLLAGRYGKRVIDAFRVKEPTVQSILSWHSSNNRQIVGAPICGSWDETSATGMSSYEMEDLLHRVRELEDEADSITGP